MSNHYVLKAKDGRLVTNDTQKGASLTKIAALCYVWNSKEAAERELAAYQLILGTKLDIAIYSTKSGLNF